MLLAPFGPWVKVAQIEKELNFIFPEGRWVQTELATEYNKGPEAPIT